MNSQEYNYEFHFKGVYAGETVKRVFLSGDQYCSLKKNEEYLLYIELYSVLNGSLKGKIVKFLKLSEAYDRS